MEEVQTITLAARYSMLESDRAPYLERARAAAAVTVPSLMPPAGASGGTKLSIGFQSLGARLVNHLSSKLVLALLPPNRPFHRTDIDEISLTKLAPNPGEKAALQDSLAKYDRALNTHIEASQLRHKSNEALKQVLVAGTVVAHIQDERLVRVHKLDSFVQQLDSTGALLELIIKEAVSPETLTEEIRQACQIQVDKRAVKRQDVFVYTTVNLNEYGKYDCWQEINGLKVPGSEGVFTKESLPFLSVRFSAVDGENYGRSYCEAYIGDLVSLEKHCKALSDAGILSSRIIFTVKPGSLINIKQLERAKNGAVLRGEASDVSTIRVDKSMDMRASVDLVQEITSRLSYAFLLNSAIQRSGERVTAEEIRIMARELEEGLGGVYSLLSQEFQLPLVRVYRSILERKGKLPPLPKDIISVKIVTGIEAQGRGQDVDALQLYLQDLAQFGSQAFTLLNMREIAIRLAVARGIDTSDLVKTQDQLAAEKQQEQLASMAQQAAPGVIQQAAQGVMAGQLDPAQLMQAAQSVVPETTQ